MATPLSDPPYRADHVGSLLRPRELLAAEEAFAAGQLDAAAHLTRVPRWRNVA